MARIPGSSQERVISLGVDWMKFIWKDTSLFDGLENGDKEVSDAVMAVLEYKAPQVEAYMKQNAPWQDQTGNARQGLRAEAYDLGGSQKGIILYGQVPYQIWLEVKYSGRYAIIVPTIQVMGPEVMKSLEGILGKVKFTS